MKRTIFAAMTGLALVLNMNAGIHTESVEYKDGDVALEGYSAYDDSVRGPRPGVLIVVSAG